MRKVRTQKCATTFALFSIVSSSRNSSPTGSAPSGLLVPPGSHEPPPQHGIVLAVGPGLDWWEQAGIRMPVKPGDHVVFPASAGAVGRGRRGAAAGVPRRRAAGRPGDRSGAGRHEPLTELGEGIWRWTLRHPEWHPTTEFGSEVGCYAVALDGGTLLIDPLFDGAVEEELDAVVSGDVVVAVTIPYHVRSSAEAVARWGGTIVGAPPRAASAR